jgi:hypothetical protein
MARGTGGRGPVSSIVRLVGIIGGVFLAVAVVAIVLVALLIADPSAGEVVQAFRDEGLEAGEEQQIDRDEDRSFVPKTYEEQVSFAIPSVGERTTGRVYTFQSREDLEQVREHYEGFEGLFPSYVYVEGNVLVQIPGGVSEEQAERYGEVLQET